MSERYDVVYFTPEHKAEARGLVRRIPDEERIARFGESALAIRVVEGVPMPGPDRKRSGLVGTVYIHARLGTLAFQPDNIKDLDLLVELKPGLVVGNIRESAFETAEYVAAIEHERHLWQARESKRAAREAALEEARAQETAKLIASDAVAIARLAGVKEEKLTEKRLRQIVANIAESDATIAALLRSRWEQAAAAPVNPVPEEIADDPQARAAHAMSGFNFRHERVA